MSQLFKCLLALLLAVLWVGSAVAGYVTGYDTAPQRAYAPTTMPKQVEGKIMAVDPAERKLTLDDGTQLLIPAWVDVDWQILTQGNTVKARYENQGGLKVATHIELKW
jgi:hypothetical protein